MDANIIELVIKTRLRQMSERLEQAASLGKAAVACADTGNISKGMEVAFEVNQIIYGSHDAVECGKHDQPGWR